MPNTNQSTIQNGIDAAIAELEQMPYRLDSEDLFYINIVIEHLKDEKVRRYYGHVYHIFMQCGMFLNIANEDLRAAINKILDENIVTPYLPFYAYKRNATLFFGAIGLLVGATITSILLNLLPLMSILYPVVYLACAFEAYRSNYHYVAALLIAPLFVVAAICTAIGAGIGYIFGTIAGNIAQLCTSKDAPVSENISHEPTDVPTESSTRVVCNTLGKNPKAEQVLSVSERRYQRLAAASSAVSIQAPVLAPSNDSILTSSSFRPMY